MSRASARLVATAVLRWSARVVAFVLLIPVSTPAQQPMPEGVSEELRSRVEQLRTTGALRIGGELVAARALSLAVYERRGFVPLWTSEAAVVSLVHGILGVEGDGLDPDDYHLSALRAGVGERGDPASAAELDLLRTDALVRVGHDLRFGKTEPQGPVGPPREGWPAGNDDEHAVAELIDIVASAGVREALMALRPRHFAYTGLRRALSDLRRIQEWGGWEPIPSGPLMGRDSVDERVPLLRARLALEGDLATPVDRTSRRYDPTLEAAIRSFQHRHGLNEDGLVESVTLAALNVPVEERVDQVRVNLERARWVGHELPDTLVAVNVAGARAYLIRGDSVVFETRAIVGADATRTPVFTADMRYAVLNPTWTVPPSALDEVLDLVRRDPDYLRIQGMHVLDGSAREVDAAGIDFSRYTAADFPHFIRQDPGPANPLGRIKLMLPNPYHVYLHDTPGRSLFAREERLFSHGCIRIEDPLGLAELVLGDPSIWSRGTLQTAIASGETRTIPLARPIPVFVLYWTAAVDPDGSPHFYPDVYGRDAAVLAALRAGPGRGTPGSDPR